MKRLIALNMALAVASYGLIGCGPIKLPSMPKALDTPGTAVAAVRLVESGPRAARYDIDVSIYNPNDVPLPMTFAEYELTVDGATYRSDALPRATAPALRRITISLPAVLVWDDDVSPPAGGTYEASGRIIMTPPGEVRRLLYEIGLPKPRMKFTGQGEITPAMETQ